jgi:hypothetical protein
MKTLTLLLLLLSGCAATSGTLPEDCKHQACDYCRDYNDPSAPLTLQPVVTTLPPDPKTLLSCEVLLPGDKLGWCCPNE